MAREGWITELQCRPGCIQNLTARRLPRHAETTAAMEASNMMHAHYARDVTVLLNLHA